MSSGSPLMRGSFSSTQQRARPQSRTTEPPTAEAKIKTVLATLRVGPGQPVGTAWPRTDTAPTGELMEIRKPVEVLADYDQVTLTYRKSERGSGMIVGATSGDSFTRISAFTCDSIVEIDGRTGSVTRNEVTPDERAMFDRFVAEIGIR